MDSNTESKTYKLFSSSGEVEMDDKLGLQQQNSYQPKIDTSSTMYNTTKAENTQYSHSSSPCRGMNMDSNDIDITWQELHQLEDKRRKLLSKGEDPIWRILASWKGTSLSAMVKDPLIWATVAIYVGLRLQARLGGEQPDFAGMFADTNIDILGGFLSFLLVLFVNQTNGRFFEMYQRSKAAAGRVQDVAGFVSMESFPHASANRLVRYMNAAHVSGYVGMGGPYTKSNFFDQINSEHQLLNAREMERIDELNMNSGAAVFKELCTWCEKDVGKLRKANHIDSYEALFLHNKILDFRAAMDGIYDYRDQPTHYFYIHFLCLLSALYLPLFAVDNAYSAGWGANTSLSVELLNGLIVFVQCVFAVGLRLMGQFMVDPYGDDMEDLSVVTYVLGTIEHSKAILSSQTPADVDEAQERNLMKTPKINAVC